MRLTLPRIDRGALLLIAGWLTLAATHDAAAQRPRGPVAGEEEVRAAFLYQLAQYVHWPADAFASPGAPMRFCVLGSETLAPVLEQTVRGKTIDGRSIAVAAVAKPAQLLGCHVAFIGIRRERQLRDLLAARSYPAVLLVGEVAGFAELGGSINITLEEGKPTFEVNLAAAEQSRLQIRSQLLRFARIVRGKTGGPR
jgi:hypothetical protein